MSKLNLSLPSAELSLTDPDSLNMWHLLRGYYFSDGSVTSAQFK